MTQTKTNQNPKENQNPNQKTKAIIFDASPLISFSMAGLIAQLKNLKNIFNGKFLITKDVKYEIIDKPITIKKFKLEALRLKKFLNERILEMPFVFAINESEISKKTEQIKKIANSTFKSKYENIKLIDSGETSCLVLSRLLDKKGIDNVIAVDERTIRMLCEKPENLRKLLEKKLHTKILANSNNYKYFKGFKFIRSSELIYVAFKKNLIELNQGKNHKADILDALLYAVKFKGCAISGDEIKEIKRIG